MHHFPRGCGSRPSRFANFVYKRIEGFNQVAEGGAPISVGGGGAVSAAQKPTVRWLPSQNGFFADFPHRHKAILSLPGRSENGTSIFLIVMSAHLLLRATVFFAPQFITWLKPSGPGHRAPRFSWQRGSQPSGHQTSEFRPPFAADPSQRGPDVRV